MRRILAASLVLAALAPGAAARTPLVEQMVVARSGTATLATVRAEEITARVGRRRCAVPAATPLAALVRMRPPGLLVTDFGSCSRRARDASGLYVRRIGTDRARGRGGWVYKVGNRQGTAGSGDPAGPFGRGRLRSGARVTWFYCLLRSEGTCQRTLALRARPEPGGIAVRVLAYDDEGRGQAAAGATVIAERVSATTDATGFARLALPAGRHRVHAVQAGAIRSFDEAVTVP